MTRPVTPTRAAAVADRSAADWVETFDGVYREAAGRIEGVPWSRGKANPAMVAWMNRIAPACLRPGARVAVVGAGLGDDAVFLADRGYDVVGFDASAEAVAWAKRRHPGHAALFRRADVLDLPGGLMKRFDLVVEVHTLQALPPRFREALAAGLERLMCPRDGRLLVVCRGRPDAVALEEVEGPPFAFTPGELKETLSSAGLRLEGSLDDFEDDNSPPVRRLRGVFVHG